MRQASSDEELDGRIYQLGDFGRIMNVAKRTFISYRGVIVLTLIQVPNESDCCTLNRKLIFLLIHVSFRISVTWNQETKCFQMDVALYLGALPFKSANGRR